MLKIIIISFLENNTCFYCLLAFLLISARVGHLYLILSVRCAHTHTHTLLYLHTRIYVYPYHYRCLYLNCLPDFFVDPPPRCSRLSSLVSCVLHFDLVAFGMILKRVFVSSVAFCVTFSSFSKKNQSNIAGSSLEIGSKIKILT